MTFPMDICHLMWRTFAESDVMALPAKSCGTVYASYFWRFQLEVRSLHLVVSIDIANPESPIKRIKEVNSTGWTPELRELRQPERGGSFSGKYKERGALLHMSLN